MPIDPTLLIAFSVASLALLAVPGPTIIMVVSQALAHGRPVAMVSVLGVGLGDLMAASLSIAGVGTILAASATAFTVIKWLGAAYLIYIGVKMWRTPVSAIDVSGGAEHSRRWPVFRDAFFVTLFNPKGIVFFLAFVPQFIQPTQPFIPQASVLVGIFVVLGMANAAAYAVLASSARQWIKRPAVLRGATRLGALFLIAAGFASLFVRRTA